MEPNANKGIYKNAKLKAPKVRKEMSIAQRGILEFLFIAWASLVWGTIMGVGSYFLAGL